jgi:phage shock protein A
MTVSELIMNWTEEERKQHTNLIMECLEREQLLNDLKGKIEASEKDLIKIFDQLLSGLSQLSQSVNQIFDKMENIYLYLAKAQGNA